VDPPCVKQFEQVPITTLTVLPVIEVEHPASRIPRDISESVHCTDVFSKVKSLAKAVQTNKKKNRFVVKAVNWFEKCKMD